MKKRIFSAIFTVLFGINLLAQNIETFNFNGALNANGWTTHSGATPGQFQTIATPSDQANSLYANNLPNSAGNRAVFVAGNTEDVNKAISGLTGTGYYSFLLKVTNTTGLSATGDYFTGFGQTTGAAVTIFAPRVFIKAGVTPNTFQLGVQNTTGGTPTQSYGSTEYPVGTTVMVVVKLNASVSPIEASLFVNPNVTAVEPAPTVSNNSGTNPFTTFASIFLRHGGNATSGTGNLEIDEIRWGSTWESVTPENSCATSSAISVTTCNSYTVPSGSATYTQSGSYTDTLTNAALCDSIISINLTIVNGITYYADVDGDGLGNPQSTQIACSPPVGFVTNANDCNDGNNQVGAPTNVYYHDVDGDTFGSTTDSIVACTQPLNYVTNNLDCNDQLASVNPNATDIPDNGIDENCNGADATAAGSVIGMYEFTQAAACPVTALDVSLQPSFAVFGPYGTSGTSCNAANNVFNNSGWNTTAAIDLTEYNEFSVDALDCYTLDLNKIIFTHRISSSGGTPTWTLRSSLDNFTTDLATGMPLTTDKTDTITLGSSFDAVDQVTFRFYITNMAQSGSTWRNDNVMVVANFASQTPQMYYADLDGDGFGNPLDSIEVCTPSVGYVSDNSDCNDADSLINPQTVWYADVDGDGVGDGMDSIVGCTAPTGYVLTGGDCNDGDSTILGPQMYYTDADNDGYGDANTSGLSFCSSPGFGFVTNNGDCDDAEPSINPGATEICDGLDNDCQNGPDDGLIFATYYEDLDDDNFGSSTSVTLCEPPLSGYSLLTGDCDDNNPLINPDAVEVLNNGVDENCDGTDNYAQLVELSKDGLMVVPNPNNGLFQLHIHQDLKGGKVQFIDLQGRLLREIVVLDAQVNVDMSEIHTGTYFVQLVYGDKMLRLPVLKL
jgi:hypothetical protein